MRFRVRMKVDFPQPDGPISAVTVPDQKSRDISLRTSLSPNQAWTPRASSPTPRAPDPGFFFAAALAATLESDDGVVVSIFSFPLSSGSCAPELIIFCSYLHLKGEPQ